jgi:hypothetical protein
VVAVVVGGAGIVLAAFGVLIWASIPRSDTTTSSLVVFGLPFVLAGVVLCAAAWALLRRERA